MNWQPQLNYAYHGNMMRQGKIYHILLDIMKKPGKKKKHFQMDSVTRKGALRAIFAKRFTIVKVDLFYLNVTRDQLPKNLPDLYNIYAFI